MDSQLSELIGNAIDASRRSAAATDPEAARFYKDLFATWILLASEHAKLAEALRALEAELAMDRKGELPHLL